jgi:hypothetical protein
MPEMRKGFPRLQVEKKTGDEYFRCAGQAQGFTLQHFWQWFASDLANNVIRGVLAEYIVAQALGVSDGIRESWAAYDLKTPEGVKIEVKSAAYLQSWYHQEYSKIEFSIGPTKEYNPDTNKLATESKRQADIYVFCLLNHKDKETLDPLDIDQWEFYILPASVLNEKRLLQKKIGLASLLRLEPCKARYDEIAACVKLMARATKSAI